MSALLPGSDLDDSLWAQTASPLALSGVLLGRHECDVVVIGGGYTGLSTALHAADAGASVIVLEACEPGFGASGRNTGEVVPGWSKQDPQDIVAQFGAERGERMNTWVQDNADRVFELIERHNIECEAVRNGWLMPASNARRLGVARGKFEGWHERNADVAMLDRAETCKLTGSEHYLGAWLHRGGGMIQPLGYARGLARAAEQAGASVFSNSPATAIAREGAAWCVRTPSGSVTAPRVVVATNAYSAGLFPVMARALIPVRLFQTATAPMGDNLAATVLPDGHGISDARRVLWAFRKDADGRLITGVHPLGVRASRDAMTRMARHQLDTVFPQIGNIDITHFWNGQVAVTLDRLPRMADLGEGIHAGYGYSGRGIAMATGMGYLLARRALGDAVESLALPLSTPRPLPLHGLAIALARVRAWWWRSQDTREDRA
jgi:glycine/D-amino acid oxidase-like deaminating enzyme